MKSLIKHYWAEILTFGVIFGVLLICLSPDITWMETDSDGAHYILAAKYMLVAHNTSAPLYLLLGRLFLFLPIGSEAWRMGLISVLATIGGVFFVYLIVRRLLFSNSKARFYALISAIVYGSSALVISQSTIIETYPLSTMLMLSAYYLCLKRNWVVASMVIGLLWAVHTLFAWMIWAVLFLMHKELRNLPLIILTLVFLSFYAYIPIVKAIHEVPPMWGNTNLYGFLRANFGVLLMLAGGLSMWDFPKRLLDTIGILGVSLGFGLIIIAYYFYKGREWKQGLLWLFLLPILWFATNLSAETYVYMLPSIAFGAVAVGLGLSKMRWQWAVATLVIAVGLMGFNANYFDIGREGGLDPEMSAMKFYNEELPKIPDGEIFMGGGWTWAMVYLYNKEEGRNIIPVSTDVLPSEEYLTQLENQGIKLVRSKTTSQITLIGEVSLSIAELNEGVWIAKETKPEVYQYVIEPAKGNEAYIGRWIGQEVVTPEWKWKPSNPYLYISGQLEILEWHHVLQSTYNMLLIQVLGILGYGFSMVLVQMWKKQGKGKKHSGGDLNVG
jgi:hypothetical protein